MINKQFEGLISIVIPVYNVENILRRCIDSILAQTYSAWECILVDDESPDNSGEICDEYAKMDKRIKVFHIKNGGPSNARNVGLENARGDFVCFADSDDWVEPTYLEHLLCGYNSAGAGVVVGGHISDAYDVHEERRPGAGFFLSKDFNKVVSEKKVIDWGYTHVKLYKTAIIKNYNICFPVEVKFCEDLIFFLQYLMHCDWIAFIDELDYHYIAPVGTTSLAQTFHSFESEYLGYRLIRQSVEQMQIQFQCSDAEMEYSFRSTTSKLMRAITTMYRKGRSQLRQKERLIRLSKCVTAEDYLFAAKYSSGKMIDRTAIDHFEKGNYRIADFILSSYFTMRYNKLLIWIIRTVFN